MLGGLRYKPFPFFCWSLSLCPPRPLWLSLSPCHVVLYLLLNVIFLWVWGHSWGTYISSEASPHHSALTHPLSSRLPPPAEGCPANAELQKEAAD